MNSQIVNQYMFKINEAKLEQDLKIADLVRSDFDNYVGTLERSLENEMLGSCQRYRTTSKDDFNTCITQNGKRMEAFKEFSKQYKNKFLGQYYGCQQKLKLMGFKPTQRQAFHTIVDLEESSIKISQLLQQEAFRTKANEWRK